MKTAKKTDAIIIMDGFGHRDETRGNAVLAAGTPYLNSLFEKYPHTLIEASGRAVGLPAGQMGNSEVGHLNLGAGRVVYQDITRIDKAIEDGEFFANPALVGAVENAKTKGTALHLVGLLSNGGVHSSNAHLYALLELARRGGLDKVFVHCVTDGRDVPPDSAAGFVAELEEKIREIGVGKIASVEGRYYYMDRDNRWERVKKGYDNVFAAVGGERFSSAAEGIAKSYENKVFDEFIVPFVVGDYDGVHAGDSMIFFNFRSDRAREITRAAIYEDFDAFDRAGGYKPVYYVGMTQYDATFTGLYTAFGPRKLVNTLGEYLSKKGLTQARVAETEKYAHVTFFFNGGVEQPNPGEQRVLVASPKVATYDLQPEMSAPEVTQKALEVVGKVDVLILNFANCDMVGHTGVFDAAVKAVRTVDECLSRLVPAILATGGTALVTADHGNAEQMCFDDGSPCTSHTTNLVPFVLVGDKFATTASHTADKSTSVSLCAGDNSAATTLCVGDKPEPVTLRDGGALCDVAPTLLKVMNLPQPLEMEGSPLIK